MSNSKKNHLGVFSLVLLVILVFILILYTSSCSGSFDFTIGGKENKKILNELNENFKLNDNYELKEVDIDGLYGEWITKKDEMSSYVILQLHGGAYIRDLNYRENLYQRMASYYLDNTGYSVLTIDYTVATNSAYPAALDDAIKAYDYLLETGYSEEDIIVVGDSAGGGLALALCLYLRDNKRNLPRGIVTMSAWTNLYYKRRKVEYIGDNDPFNPYISPMYGEFDGFPPMLMQVGTKDILNDTLEVERKALESGVDVKRTTYKGMVHVFQALAPRKEEANDAWKEVKEFILYLTN